MLQSAMFEPGFQEKLGITYGDILWPATGERLTAESFTKYRKEAGWRVIFMIPEVAADQAYRDPHVMVASDGGFRITDGKPVGHPRSAGTACARARPLRSRTARHLADGRGAQDDASSREATRGGRSGDEEKGSRQSGRGCRL